MQVKSIAECSNHSDLFAHFLNDDDFYYIDKYAMDADTLSVTLTTDVRSFHGLLFDLHRRKYFEVHLNQ